MGEQNHIIRKLTLEIGLPTREEAFNIQNKLTENYRRLILQILEEVFDRMVGKDEVIQIDKLEIDLGNISTGEMDYKIPEKVRAEMEEALSKLIHEIRHSPGGNANVRITTSGGDTITVNASVQEQTRSAFDTLIYFLEFGVLPWSGDQKKKPTLRELIAEAMQNHPEQLRQVLQQFNSKQYVFRRMAQQLPEDQAQYLAAILGCGFSSQLIQLSNQLQHWVESFFRSNKKKTHIGKTFFTNELKQKITEETLVYFSSSQNGSAIPTFYGTREPLPHYISFILERIFSRYEIDPDSKSIQSVKGDFEGELKKVLHKLVKQKEVEEKGKKKREKGISQEKKTSKKKSVEKEILKETKTGKGEIASEELKKNIGGKENLPEIPDTDEGIYIANAGLVILAPYLSNFFTNLGLLKDRQFINDESRYKAVHLLQWMVYGDEKKEEEENEHDLVLNKIICGIPLAEPVPVSLELSETDKEECTALLKAIIANWAIIKRSSVHSLRVTFLQKEGKLTREEKDWSLFIHRDSAVEILIDRLPWQISILRFAWSKATIYVQW